MATFLDIIGGIFIGGLILLIALTATDNGMEAFFNYNADAIVQQRLTGVSDIIQHDLRKMGYGIPESQRGQILQVEQADRLRFIAQLNPSPTLKIGGINVHDQVVDTIEYRIVPADSITIADSTLVTYSVLRTIIVPGIQNKTMEIGRIGNSDVFRYLNQIGNPVALLTATKMVEVNLSVIDPHIVLSKDLVTTGGTAADSTWRREELRRMMRNSYWRQTRLVSRNLRR